MIILFTDYGDQGPYPGQVEARIASMAPRERVINLTANAPRNNPRASAYLLAAYCRDFPEGTVFFCVVDPGVGSFDDLPIILEVDGRTFVGPDNGLFDIVVRFGKNVRAREIIWKPGECSKSFHGRDIYAPVCGMLAKGIQPETREFTWQDRHNWPDDLYEVIYIDHFGNCMTGIRACSRAPAELLYLADAPVASAGTFSEVNPGQVFWYQNANGLVEIAVNQGNAAEVCQLQVGMPIHFD